MQKRHPAINYPTKQGRQKPANFLNLNGSFFGLQLQRTQIKVGNPKPPFSPGMDTAFRLDRRRFFRNQPNLNAEPCRISERDEFLISVQQVALQMRPELDVGSCKSANPDVSPSLPLATYFSAVCPSCPKPRDTRAKILDHPSFGFFARQIRCHHASLQACFPQAVRNREAPGQLTRSSVGT